ncbi:TIGR04222 domain-containing membrane protein [Streptomyces sp. NPDC006208]|uniref:TIGR04222 domain-containing membrane protein n=1 Tax=Streptomyces sp. NPDC006208 TaxID=3156734 RepID=UPI0033A5E7B4
MPLDMWWFIGAAGACLAAAAALLLLPGAPVVVETPGPQSVALLRGGRRAAVVVALVALHQRGVVTTGRHGTVRTDGWTHVAVRDRLQLAVHTSLRRPVGVRVVVTVPRVQKALDALRDECAAAGLLRANARWRAARVLLCAVPLTIVAGLLVRPMTAPNTPLQLAISTVPLAVAAALWAIPRRTRAARRLLESLRERRPIQRRPPRGAAAEQHALMSVALYGDRALQRYVPHFARDGGLLGHGSRNTGIAVFNTAADPRPTGAESFGCGAGSGD